MLVDMCSLSVLGELANGTYNVEAFGQFAVIFIPHHLEKVQMSEMEKMGSESNDFSMAWWQLIGGLSSE